MKVKSTGSNQVEIQFDTGIRVLVSYRTPVAVFVPGRGYIRTDESFSRTTAKHINQWLGGPYGTRVPQREIEVIASGQPSDAAKPRFKPQRRERVIEL